MKKLPLQNVSYRYILKSYQEWLDILGYAPITVATLPSHVKELLHHLEQHNIHSIKSITSQHISSFLQHIHQRSNQTKAGALSSNTIRKIVLAINSFNRYLQTTGKHDLNIVPVRLSKDQLDRIILTKEEVAQLFEATYASTNSARGTKRRGAGTIYGQRDRAMLAVLYGCGARRNEAIQLDITDIQRDNRLLHVRHGKGGKKRLVPITPAGMDYLTTWLDEGRPRFTENKDKTTEALFTNQSGQRMQDFYQRLKLLHQTAQLDKPLTPHGLRHSIATHLLHAGMELEDISRFLGHSTLESTQIYTHILDDYGHQL